MNGRYLIVLAALMALTGCGGAAEAPAPAAAPLVSVAEAAPAQTVGTVRASGLVAWRREPALAFASPGVVTTIAVEAGDAVRRGQLLATQRRTSVGTNADEAALARANAERDLARTQELYDRGFVSEARLEDARLAVERTSDSSAITAPADGLILRRVAEPSQTVAAGAPVLVLGESNSGLVVRAPVASAEAARIRVGDTARLRVGELSESTWQGRVRRVGAKGDAGTGAFEVEVEIENAGALRSGMVAEVEIDAASPSASAGAILVPTLALLDARADQGVVFVVNAEGVAQRRAVRTAGVTQEGVLVVEGLAEGERVIAAGAAYVRDGEPVRLDPSN